MRICISGAPNTGKQNFVEDFSKEWDMYSVYRADKSKPGFTKEELLTELNACIDNLQQYKREDNIIFDNSPIDYLVYSFWAADKGIKGFDKELLNSIVPLVRESMRFVDIVFFTPISLASPIEEEKEDVIREELDNIYKAIVANYHTNLEADMFFPKDDCPSVIDIFGTREQRILLVKNYISMNGDVFGSEEDSILNPENLQDMENILKSQLKANEEEQRELRTEAMKKVVTAYSKKLKLP
jgi:hypothetical protein